MNQMEKKSLEDSGHPLVIQINMYYRQIYHNHLHQGKKEDHLQTMKQFLVNTVNKCNKMTMNLKMMMMMIIFSIREGENMYFFHKNVHDYDMFIFIYVIF